MLTDTLNIRAWHGTTQENADGIRRYGFNKIEIDFRSTDLRNPNDLGEGIYFYIDSTYELGHKLANKYAHQYRDKIAKQQKCSIETIEVEISLEKSKLLDLDNEDTKQFFIDFSKKHETERNKLIYSLKNDGAKRRKNYDGIMVELFVRHINKQVPNGVVQAVQKETYTMFDNCISNFPNGKELCVRDSICINLRDKEKINNGNEFKKFL